MKSKILATTLVGLLFGLVACEKSQESVSTEKMDNKQTEQVEQKQLESAVENSTETPVQHVQTDKMSEGMKSTTEEASTDSAINQEKLAENKVKQVEAKKVAEKNETKKVIAILEKQYQSLHCTDGNKSEFCVEEAQRLKSEIERLKSQLRK
ncbi:hypothetical protein [Histophilus somni]|uniref:Lipoprotein n=1 Tax=Histophilus somni TaxID=731 RepID=A0A9Q6YZI5_HISSO|nr:hypothetical protein [Histophilus somni]ACA32468.1 Haemophilus-specific protein, uncharacterized [Histophilus somni 2336]ARU65281.1 hypothetical protein BTV18_07100 [Histophilus somni]ARU67147.1 hypothetical protein BTV19_07530 [Histophilus somni]ARU69023.1 hypothetical protein BTV16_07540 [Histophilus somni]ARU70903.1 hypothetical protein BTV20_07540 [Histophilus somni]